MHQFTRPFQALKFLYKRYIFRLTGNKNHFKYRSILIFLFLRKRKKMLSAIFNSRSWIQLFPLVISYLFTGSGSLMIKPPFAAEPGNIISIQF